MDASFGHKPHTLLLNSAYAEDDIRAFILIWPEQTEFWQQEKSIKNNVLHVFPKRMKEFFVLIYQLGMHKEKRQSFMQFYHHAVIWWHFFSWFEYAKHAKTNKVYLIPLVSGWVRLFQNWDTPPFVQTYCIVSRFTVGFRLDIPFNTEERRGGEGKLCEGEWSFSPPLTWTLCSNSIKCTNLHNAYKILESRTRLTLCFSLHAAWEVVRNYIFTVCKIV